MHATESPSNLSIRLDVAYLRSLLDQYGLKFNEDFIQKISKKIFVVEQIATHLMKFVIKKKDFFGIIAGTTTTKENRGSLSSLEDEEGDIEINENSVKEILEGV